MRYKGFYNKYMKKDNLKMLSIHRAIDVLVIKSWWVYLVLIICIFLGHQVMKKKDEQIEALKNKNIQLSYDKKVMKEHNEELNCRIYSQSDPQWVEQVLKKELGVVPDGYVKVHFTQDE